MDKLKELREIFQDGDYHSKRDLMEHTKCHNIAALKYQLILYRRALPDDEKLICELVRRTIGYRHVKLLNFVNAKE